MNFNLFIISVTLYHSLEQIPYQLVPKLIFLRIARENRCEQLGEQIGSPLRFPGRWACGQCKIVADPFFAAEQLQRINRLTLGKVTERTFRTNWTRRTLVAGVILPAGAETLCGDWRAAGVRRPFGSRALLSPPAPPSRWGMVGRFSSYTHQWQEETQAAHRTFLLLRRSFGLHICVCLGRAGGQGPYACR